MRRKLLCFALSVLGSAFLFTVLLPPELLLPVGVIVCITFAVHTVLRSKIRHIVTEGAFLVACGMAFALLLVLIWNMQVLSPALSYDGVSANLVMTVCEPPYEGEGYTSFEANVTRIGTEAVSMRVRVTAEEGFAVSLGDRLTAFGELHASSDDQKTYDRAKGILMRVQLRSVEVRETPETMPFYLLPAYVSQEIGAKFDAFLSEDASGLISALILGDQTKLTAAQRLDLRRTGLSHVVAVSGLHVSFLVGLLMTVFRRRLGMALSVPALLFFAVMTGASPSVMRAVIMQLVWIFSFPLKRENDAPTAMGFAAVCILCMNPYAAGDISLWLSFGSTIGITLWGGRLTAFFAERFPKSRRKLLSKPVRYVASALGTTFASQVFVLPLSLAYFRETSILSPLSNLLLLGVVQVVFFLGVICAAMAFLLPGLIAPVTVMTEMIVWVFMTVVGILADIPFSYAAADTYLWIAVGAIYALVGLYLLLHRLDADQRISLRACVCMLAVVVSVAVICRCAVAQTSGYLLVPQMRGGQFVAMTARDVCVAVNCGGYAGIDGVTEALGLREVRDIDLMVVTDYNTTSTNGLADLMEEIEIKRLLLPSPRKDAEYETALLLGETALTYGIEVRYAGYGDDLTAETYNLGAVTVTCAVAGDAQTDRRRLIVGLAAGEMEVVVTGNVKPETLDTAVARYELTDADVIALSSYYGSSLLPERLLGGDKTIIATGYDGVAGDVLQSFGEREDVFLPTYESITLRFGL